MDLRRVFDLRKLSITLLTPAPIDISSGISERESAIKIDKVTKDLVKTKTGLGGEVLISEQFDDIHLLTIVYLPTSKAVQVFEILRKLKTQFGIVISNNSAPQYKGAASDCRLIGKPDTSIGVKSGFADMPFRIIMTDYIDVFTGAKASL